MGEVGKENTGGRRGGGGLSFFPFSVHQKDLLIERADEREGEEA